MRLKVFTRSAHSACEQAIEEKRRQHKKPSFIRHYWFFPSSFMATIRAPKMSTWNRCLYTILLLGSQALSYALPPPTSLFETQNLSFPLNQELTNISYGLTSPLNTTTLGQFPDSMISPTNLQIPEPFSYQTDGMNITLYGFEPLPRGYLLGVTYAFAAAKADAEDMMLPKGRTMGSQARSWLKGGISFLLIPTEALLPIPWLHALKKLVDGWFDRLDRLWTFSFSMVDEVSGREIGSGKMKVILQIPIPTVARRGLV